jgi:hypothetical protein
MGFPDHYFVAGIAADDRVGSGFDVADFLRVDDKLLTVEACEKDHGGSTAGSENCEYKNAPATAE